MNRSILLLGALALLVVGCSGGGGECKQDSDCAPGRFCDVQAKLCIFQCTYDADCRADQVCSARGRCEVGCRTTNGGLEDCDGLDNDCDGQTDEELGAEFCQRENVHGLCEGVRSCQTGAWVCDAAEPEAEYCDGADNNCDGATDEGLSDQPCDLTEGVCAGSGRTCQGEAGWSQCDYGPEHQPGVEASCDGLDNDCDGQTDEDLGTLTCPLTMGVCGEVVQVCLGEDGWSECDYGADHEPDGETRCDGLDNDCDGQTDEELVADYSVCEVGPLAVDGLDNNCDGLTDEPGGCVIQIPGRPVWIDVYESTFYETRYCSGRRYGENADDYPNGFPDTDEPPDPPVSEQLYACSLAGATPSSYMTWYQASRACIAQGKRLCTKAEWTSACGGDFPDRQDYPYGDTFQAGVCTDFTVNPDEPVPAGYSAACVSPAGAYDMSGNLFEWVADTCSWDADRKAVQGGAYLCEYCDPQDNCEPCDLDNPLHVAEIENRYDCMHTDDPWWCAGPTGSWNSEGTRCCWDGPE